MRQIPPVSEMVIERKPGTDLWWVWYEFRDPYNLYIFGTGKTREDAINEAIAEIAALSLTESMDL